MIIIQPSGGLCNRIRVINSAHQLAKKRGEKLIVLWKNCAELNCPFETLYEPVTEIKIINFRSNFNLIKLWYQFTSGQRYTNDDILKNKTNGILHDSFFEQLKKRVFIFTWEHFYPSQDYHLFIPQPFVQQKINALTSQFGQNCIGVHIRRTDNMPAIDKSSTAHFIEQMQTELDQNPDTKFFVATDDIHEEESLRKAFPQAILSNQNKTLSRDSVDGMIDALVDLMCLSETKKIYGSFWSSFTDIAADIKKIPKKIVGE